MGLQRERRWRIRFPIALEVRYRSTGKQPLSGCAQTVNISSRGLLMATGEELLPGTCLKLFVDWPIRLDGTCFLTLHAGGKVVRVQSGEVAVQFRQYEWRTRSAAATRDRRIACDRAPVFEEQRQISA